MNKMIGQVLAGIAIITAGIGVAIITKKKKEEVEIEEEAK